MKSKKSQRKWAAPEMKRIDNDDYELIGANPEGGFETKAKADKKAEEWKAYPKGGKARVLKLLDGNWYVYGN